MLVEHCFEIMSEPNETLTAPRRATRPFLVRSHVLLHSKERLFSRLNGIRTYTQLTNENESDEKKRSISWVCTGQWEEPMEGEQTNERVSGVGPLANFWGKTRALAQNKVPLEKTNRNGPLLNKPVGLGS